MKNSIKLYQNKVLKKPLFSFLLLYLLITLLIIIIGFFYFSSQKSKIIDNRFAYLQSMAEFHSSQINDWLIDKYNDLKIIEVSMPRMDGAVPSSTGLPKEFQNWFSILKKYYGYENVILFKSNMKFTGGLSPLSSPLMKSDSLLIKMVLDSNIVAFSDSDEKTADQNLLRFYLPVKYPAVSEKTNAVLFVSIDSRTTFESILNRNIDKSPTLEALLVKAVGDSVTYLNKLRFSDRMRESQNGDDNKALYKTSPISNRRGFVAGIDYKNDPVIANIQKINSTAWLLITKLNQSEFYEPVNNLAGIVALVIISSDLFFALILFFIWRKNIVANARKIYEAEIEKSRLENRFQSLVNGVKNIEIILLDRNGKIISWNKGAENIEGYSADEITGKSVSVLYTEDDRFKGKPESLLKEAADTGNSQSEGWRIRKDGSVYWANIFTTS
ncbi:MAG: PAS domain S-box protein, partial [Melioribacteraceae bacterium]